RCQQPGVKPDTMAEVVERKLCLWVVAHFELADIIADAGQTFQTAFPIAEVLNRRGGHAFLADQVQNDTRINLSWPRTHGQTIECGEAHRAFNAASICERAHR